MKKGLYVLITLVLTLSFAGVSFGQDGDKDENSKRLMLALMQRPEVNVAEILELIRKGVEVNVYAGNTMLNRAIETKKIEIVKALLEAGADPNEVSAHNGNAALHEAAGYNVPPAMIALLIKYKADPNRETLDGRVPLHFIASFSGDAHIAQELLKGGANPNLKTRYGITPLEAAAKWPGKKDVVEFMTAALPASDRQALEAKEVEIKKAAQEAVASRAADPEPLDLDGIAEIVTERQNADGYKLMDEGFAETQGRNSNDPSIGVKKAIFPRNMTRLIMISKGGLMINAVMNGTLLTVPCSSNCETSISTYITGFGNLGTIEGHKILFLDVVLINFQNNFINYILKSSDPGSEAKWMLFSKAHRAK